MNRRTDFGKEAEMATKKKKRTKADIEKLEKALKSKPTLIWDRLTEPEKKEAQKITDDYKSFLDACKTERETVREIMKRAEKAGFKEMSAPGKSPKRFWTHMGKVVFLTVQGQKPITEGLRLIISHIDAPRLDLKPKPLYEEVDLAMLKSQYYGGIKKYQWLSRPLALHGFVVKSDGDTVNLVFGEDENDPVLTIPDLLPHLSRKVQNAKKVTEAFPGEKMNLVAGSLPLGNDEVKERFKLALLEKLNGEWGLIEEDFISAELEVVPAGKARDVGLDRGLIGAYGQDDRACAYTSLTAMLNVENPPQTIVAAFVDREEIGSDGATGAKSKIIEAFVADLLESRKQTPSLSAVRKTLMNSKALSADVEAATDPDFQEVHEKMNAARMGYGICLTKYTGSGGKYGASEASAEFIGWLRGVFNRNDIVWQSSLLGKIDEGGGGTVAMYLAEHGMQIADCGPSMLAMHSPFEISSKADIYMTAKAYQAFYQAD